jgi:hypothetical protein
VFFAAGSRFAQGENSCHWCRSFTCANTTAGGAAISVLRSTCSSLAATPRRHKADHDRGEQRESDSERPLHVYLAGAGASGKRGSSGR